GGAAAEGRQVQQSPAQLWARPGDTVELSCRVLDQSSYVNWYKEKPDGSLNWSYRSFHDSSLERKYLGRREKYKYFSLTISSVRREDSGVYYCSSSEFYPSFGDGTRLIVTSECPAGRTAAGDIPREVCATPDTPFPSLDATQPQLSILVPVDAEEPGQPLSSIPLLCRLHDPPQGWDTVRWQPGGEETPVTVTAMDERGVFSAWSITWVPAKQW
ncbi:KV5AF protein, partial [Anhinga rufa]|nr:KV5AF protein [Anhinga rufa]